MVCYRMVEFTEWYTVEPLNNGHGGDEHFVHCSEVVPSSEVMYGQLMAGGKQFAHCREVIGVSIIGGFTVCINTQILTKKGQQNKEQGM